MLTEEDIYSALGVCYDPEIPLNIVDLGLVATVSLALDLDAPGAAIPGLPPRYAVSIGLLPTSTDEAAQAQLRAQIENRLAGLSQISRSSVTLLDLPRWTPARITPAGRRILKLDQPQFPILNNRLR